MAGLFDSLMPGNDEEQNPQSGLLASQQRQLAFNALGNIGATLMAAGQNLMPAERARILAGLGDVPNQMMAQQLAMQRMAKDRRAEAQDAELAKLGRSPEFQQAVSQMPPELQATIPALFRAGRAREAISMVGDWRQAQVREKALTERERLAQERADRPTIREVNGQLYQVSPNGTATLIPTSGGKPVDNSLRDDLNKSVTPMRGLMSLADDFKDDYAGYKIGAVGDVVNALGRNLAPDGSDTAKQAQWWQSYQEFANLKRNALFGSALTATEKSEFDKAMVNPGMKPDMIRENLRKQTAIAKSAVSRIANSAKEGGVNPKALETLMGMTFDEVGSPMTPPPPSVQQGAQGGGDAPPASALKDGHITNFANGQAWTLQGGKPVRVK